MRVPLPAAGMMPHIGISLPALRQQRFAALRPGARRCARPSVRSARRGADRRQLGVAAIERRQHVIGRPGDQDFAVGHEEFVETLPPVADDRSGAGGRLEQPPRRAPADRGHRVPRDVERQPRRRVEPRVLGRQHMAEKEDVVRPGEIAGVLRAADDEASLRPLSRRLDEQRVQGVLAVGGIGAEIGQCGAASLGRSSRPVAVGIDAAVQRRDPLRAEPFWRRAVSAAPPV